MAEAPPNKRPGKLGRWVAKLKGAKPTEPPAGALCRHAANLKPVEPQTQGCAECLADGQIWVALRMCLQCGHVGCDDSSRGKHATEHFRNSNHPLVRPLERNEDWGWCYFDQQELDAEYLPLLKKP